jgi:hypothetical protein
MRQGYGPRRVRVSVLWNMCAPMRICLPLPPHQRHVPNRLRVDPVLRPLPSHRQHGR